MTFIGALAALMPVGAPRLRRDFVTLLSLVRAHAILYRAQPAQTGRARPSHRDDLQRLRPVPRSSPTLIAEGVEAGVSDALRDTVEAVHDLSGRGTEDVSPSARRRPGIGRSASYDRIQPRPGERLPGERGTDGRRGMKLVAGGPLPGAGDFDPR